MKKVIGFNAGQFGDLIICQPLTRQIHTLIDNCHFTFAIGNKFKDISPIFENVNSIQAIHIWDSYDECPNLIDRKFLESSAFDYVFNPMPKVTDYDWVNQRYITDELRRMHNLPFSEDNKICLNSHLKLDNKNSKRVGISLFSWSESPKSITVEKAKEIVAFLNKHGYETVQIGFGSEPDLGASYKFNGSYFDAAEVILSCKFLVNIDTSWNWFASSFNLPVIGLFGYKIFANAKSSKNWQAKNPNAIYLERECASEIPNEEIFTSIKLIN